MHVATFAFDPEYEGRADWLPIAAQSAAAEKAAVVEANIPRVAAFESSLDNPTRKSPERRVPQIGEGHTLVIPGRTGVTAHVAARPIEDGQRREEAPQGANRQRSPFQQKQMPKGQRCQA